MEAELALLRLHYDDVEYSGACGLHWFLVDGLRTPAGWSPDVVPVCFAVTQGHPGTPPYGFYVVGQLTFQGAPPTEHSAAYQPPFQGTWRFLSWAPEDWRPTADVRTGANLWGWVRSFTQRMREGK